MVWDASHRGDPQGNYDRDDTSHATITLSAMLHKRLSDFFEVHFTDPTLDQWKYNCHYFAASMVDPDDAHRFAPSDHVEAVREVMRKMTLRPDSTSLELGRRAIIGAYTDQPMPAHSIIGLGESYDDCLQVIAWGGHLGLASIRQLVADQLEDTERMANFLQPEGRPQLTDYGLYI